MRWGGGWGGLWGLLTPERFEPLQESFDSSLDGGIIDGEAWEIFPHRRDDRLRMSALISLRCDRRAADDDELGVADDDRRGWWADGFGQRPIGSRLWLLESQSVNAESARLAKDYIYEALEWMIEDGLADALDVSTGYAGGRLTVSVVVIKAGDATPIFEEQDLWSIFNG